MTRPWWLVFEHESRILFADRTLWLAAAIFLALVGYGLFNGASQAALKQEALSSILAAQDRGETAYREQWERVMTRQEAPDPFSNPVDPASMGGGMGARYAYMPIGALAPLAFGQSDLLPDYYRVTNSSKVTFMYDGEIENPWNLLNGHFDLSFIVIYLAPLLIFAMTYNLLSAEREHGTLRLLLSQPIGLWSLVIGKVIVRAAALLLCTVVVPLIALLIIRPDVRSAANLVALGWWAVYVAAYCSVWFALTIAVNAWGRSSAVNALILIGSWVVLVLVVPVLLNLVVSTARPAPSRTELATRTRLVTIAGLARYDELLGTDYEYATKPELLLPDEKGRFTVAPRRRGSYLLQRDVDRELDAVLDAFRTQLAGQQALVDRFGFLSPAVVAYEGLTALAGTGVRRHQHFQRQIDEFHARWKAFFEPRIVGGIAITRADLDAMPRFVWREEPGDTVVGAIVLGLLQLALPAAALTIIGIWKLRRYAVV